MMEITALEKTTTKNIPKDIRKKLERLLVKYTLEVNSFRNDGWTIAHFKEKVKEIKEKLDKLDE